MLLLKELEVVEETKHLVPNLPILTKALFGDNAYLIPKAPYQSDWATQDLKIGDGLLWLPWKSQLWLIEVEWKEGSNFFYQSRAFAEGKVDEEKLFNQMKNMLKNYYNLLNKSMHGIREGFIIEQIVNQTLNNHIFSGYLRPHGWVILGHGKDNREKLRQDYEKELKARFREGKHYILSLARLFCGKISNYILLEQFCSKGCQELISVAPSILFPVISKYPPEEIVDYSEIEYHLSSEIKLEKTAKRTMNETEQKIINLWNAGPSYLGKKKEIARKLGVSQSYVSQVSKKFNLN